MTLVPNGLICKLVARGYCEGQEIINDTHWRIAGGGVWTPLLMNVLANRYADWWNTNLQALTIAGYVFTEMVVTQQLVEGLQVVSTAGLPQSGSAVGDGLPLNVAACVTLATSQSGRSGRGRFYMGALAENVTNGSRFTAPFVAAVNAAFENLRVLGSGTDPEQYELVVYSTIANKVPRSVGKATAVTSAYMRDNVVDSQRRRLPGRGR